MNVKVLFSTFAIIGLVLAFAPPSVQANHSWGNYHWARTSNPFTLKLGDNMTTNWDLYFGVASGDWSQSSVLDTVIVAGNTTAKRCRPTAGRIEVCNAKYGFNGWLGVAQIWVSGNHITQAITKMNDSYFDTATYNTPAWRQMVVCQEIGHTFGLDHQDENFNNANLGTCMDYTNNPSTNQHPNQHDYSQLEAIYAHLDSSTTIGQSASRGRAPVSVNVENRSDWGRELNNNGNVALFVRDLDHGQKVFTFVVWAD